MALSRSDLVILILIILLGFGLRIHDLQAVPLRGDEAFSVQYWTRLPLGEAWATVAPKDPHPPLAYALFNIWGRVIGETDTVFALRFLAVLGNMIGIPAIFALGWRLSRSRFVGILAALIWALHPFEIWHSQDYRNYAIWAGLSVTALWLGLRLLDQRSRHDWVLYAFVAASAAMIFYMEVLLTLALACVAFLTCRQRSNFLRRFLSLQLVIIVAVAMSFLLVQAEPILSGTYAGNTQAFALEDYVLRFAPVLTFGETIPFNPQALGLVLMLVVVLFAIRIRLVSARQFRFAALLILLPLLLLGAVSLFRNVFHPRYVLATVPAVILFLTLGSYHMAGFLRPYLKVGQEILTLLLLLPWFVLAGVTLDAHFNNPAFRKAPAWDEVGSFLNSRVTKDDLVINLASDAAFGYYFDGNLAEDIAFPLSPNQSADEISAVLESASEQRRSIYVVAHSNPSWPNAGLVEMWLRDNMQAVLNTDFSGLEVGQFMPWIVRDPPTTALARFDDVIELLEFAVSEQPLPTGQLLLRATWRALEPTTQPLKTFAHVYGEYNPDTGSILWTQDDQYPQQGRLDSTRWQRGEVFREIYYLPVAAIAEGSYKLHIGWYQPETDSRLLLDDGADSHFLTTLEF